MNDKRTFNGAIGTVTIGSGQTVVDVLNAAAANNVTVITGSDQTVGVAGFLSGGGHGPVTSRYGLGADQVIEMQVVTASGQLLTINTSSSPDLFWAMRGVGTQTIRWLRSLTFLGWALLRRGDICYRACIPKRSDDVHRSYVQYDGKFRHFLGLGDFFPYLDSALVRRRHHGVLLPLS